MVPASSASSISLVKRPFDPTCDKRNVGDFVARGLDDFDAGLLAQFFQPGLNPVRLPQGELGTSRTDDQHGTRAARLRSLLSRARQ